MGHTTILFPDSTRVPDAPAAEPSRRNFLRLAAGTVAAPWAAVGVATPAAAIDKVELGPILARTEKPEKTPQADPPAQRIGVAIVGLGRLSINQILPAFGKALHCRPVALVSGDRNKALALARQYEVRTGARENRCSAACCQSAAPASGVGPKLAKVEPKATDWTAKIM